MVIDLTAEYEAAGEFLTASDRLASRDNPEQIAERTVQHYDMLANSYDELFGIKDYTKDYDVTENIKAFLGHINGDGPFKILDLGCGRGRALKTFTELGHDPTGLDGAQNFVKMAREHSRCEVLHQNLLALKLLPHHFDGVFANASLYHVPTRALLQVLLQLHATLKPGSVLFSLNPVGTGYEGWFDEQRYGVLHHPDVWRSYMKNAGFAELRCFFRPREEPPAGEHLARKAGQ
jgi:SAM-dependent methyltransferase